MMGAHNILSAWRGFFLGSARFASFALGVSAVFTAGCDLLVPVDVCLHAACDAADAARSTSTAVSSREVDAADATAVSDGSVADASASAAMPSAPASAAQDSGPDASRDSGGAEGGACATMCDGATPLCDGATGECVACFYVGGTAVTGDASTSAPDEGCDDVTPRCSAARVCVGCLGDADCADGVCDPEQQACVACRPGGLGVRDPGCSGDTPRCVADAGADAGTDSPAAQCVACLNDTDCGGETPVCDVSAHACVGCLTSDDCVDPTAARCDPDTRSCAACVAEDHDTDGVNPDCTHLGGSDVCHTGSCVPCTGQFSAACGELVCDELPGASQFTCSAQARASARACEECVSDAQCDPGLNCVETTFGSGAEQEAVGYFCLYRVDSGLVGDDASIIATRDEEGVRACSSQAQPYVSSMAGTSLSGLSGSFCAPRASTCLALGQYSETPCEPAGGGDAGGPIESVVSECGEPGLEDAVCQLWDELWRCSPRCVGDADCPGGTCQVGANPRYCTF